MRIVLATPLYPPEIGGPATYAKLLAEGLPEKGIEVVLVKFGDVRHLPKGIRHIAYFWRIFRALTGADLALALDPVSVGLPVCIASWLARKPFTVKIVGDYAWEQGRQRFGIAATLDDFVKTRRVPLAVWFLRRVQTGVASYAKHVLVPSRYLEDIVAAWGIPRAKIKVIYNAVPVEAYGEVPPAVAKLSRPLVVTAGRLVPWKHIDGVIAAVAELRKNGIPASLAIVGEGPELARLVHRAEETLGGDYVFTGALSHADTLATMASAGTFVLNSSYEGLSHFLIEALTLGVPAIATAVGGNAEVIIDEETGLLVPFGDVPMLVDALMRVLADEEMRARLSTRAKESANRFAVPTMLASVARFLEHK